MSAPSRADEILDRLTAARQALEALDTMAVDIYREAVPPTLLEQRAQRLEDTVADIGVRHRETIRRLHEWLDAVDAPRRGKVEPERYGGESNAPGDVWWRLDALRKARL